MLRNDHLAFCNRELSDHDQHPAIPVVAVRRPGDGGGNATDSREGRGTTMIDIRAETGKLGTSWT